jgi:carbonic anhydrase/acetyltransferase-like protein (isoleucine patch superfamily)
MTLYPKTNLMKPLEGGAFAAEGAVLTGDITLGEDVSIWFGCVLRGDDAPLVIGARTNIQDLTMVHADPGLPNVIGEDVTVGHGCVLHGVKVGDRTLIGMGAILLAGSSIGDECLIAAGTVVKEGMQVPARSLVAGVPGRIVRQITDEEVGDFRRSAQGYVDNMHSYVGEGKGV